MALKLWDTTVVHFLAEGEKCKEEEGEGEGEREREGADAAWAGAAI